MNLRNLFELKSLLDAVPDLDYTIEGYFLYVYYHYAGTLTEFVFEFNSVEDLSF